MKYFIGFMVGVLISGAAYFFAGPTNSAIGPQSPAGQASAPPWQDEQPWSPVTTSFKYEDEQLGNQKSFTGWPPADYKYLSATSNDTLVDFTRGAIERICVQAQYPQHPDGPPPLFDANIFLKPESRKQLGKALLTRQGKDVSFRLFGLEVHHFVASREKALETINNPDGQNTEPDFSILFPGSTLITGFSMLKMLAGTDTLESCDPDDPLDNFPPYVDHKAHWDAVKKMMAEQYGD